MSTYLPEIYTDFREGFPEVARAMDALGVAVEATASLDERTRRLVKLGIAIGAQAKGAVRSNVRKAIDAGSAPEEVKQVALLAITTRGFPAAIAALGWVEEVLSAAGSEGSLK